MARKKIREYDSKRLIKAHIKRLAGIDLPLQVAQVRLLRGSTEVSASAARSQQSCSSSRGAQVTKETNWLEFVDANPWLRSTKLVVKPDMLFGKRGKHDLVGLNLSAGEAEAFIKQRMGKARPATQPAHALVAAAVPHQTAAGLAEGAPKTGCAH